MWFFDFFFVVFFSQGLANFGLGRIYDIWKLSQPANKREEGEYLLSLLSGSLPSSSPDVSVLARAMEGFVVFYFIFPQADVAWLVLIPERQNLGDLCHAALCSSPLPCLECKRPIDCYKLRGWVFFCLLFSDLISFFICQKAFPVWLVDC